MTIRPAALNRRQPAVGSLLIVTIVVPAISLKGAKNQLRRETGVPGPTPLSAEWMEKGRAGVGPIVAGVSHRRSSESRLFSSPGRSGQTMNPHWPGRFFSDLEAQSTIQIHKPLPDPFKKGTIGAARENLPPVADRSGSSGKAAKSSAACAMLLRQDIRGLMPRSCSPRAKSSSCIWVTSLITR